MHFEKYVVNWVSDDASLRGYATRILVINENYEFPILCLSPEIYALTNPVSFFLFIGQSLIDGSEYSHRKIGSLPIVKNLSVFYQLDNCNIKY